MVTASERLAAWRDKFEKRLGSDVTAFALQTAEHCLLACAIVPEGEHLEIPFPFPSEAVLSVTRTGDRGRGGPPTARGAEFAAYILRRNIPDDAEAIQEYLEALLGSETVLTRKETSHRLRRRHKEALEAARKVGMTYLASCTMEKLKGDYDGAQKLLREEGHTMPLILQQKLLRSVSTRLVLFPLLAQPALRQPEPFVYVRGWREGGYYHFEGSNFTLSDVTVRFDLKKSLEEKPIKCAAIISLPNWHAAWMGEEPLRLAAKTSLEITRRRTKS
jgi:hypothetical protein